MPELADRHMLLRQAAESLPGETPRLDAEYLLAHVLGQPRLVMLMGREPISAEALARYEALLARRRTHEPVAHILGEREFWSLDLKVTADTLVPRPDSETLIVEALAYFAQRAPQRILDLGTGSGALLLAALSEWPQATGLGIDQSAGALAVAAENAQRTGIGERAAFRIGNWLEGLEGQRFDLILCNPPYIPDSDILMPDVADFEPHTALFGGVDGLDPYRLLIPNIRNVMQSKGLALFEFGVGQDRALLEMGEAAGFTAEIAHDLAGRPRVLKLF